MMLFAAMLSSYPILLVVMSWLMDWWPFLADLCFTLFCTWYQHIVCCSLFIMADDIHTQLCSCLENWYVGNCNSDVMSFTHTSIWRQVCNYVEFSYKKMKGIFFLDQMKEWHSMLPGSTHESSNFAITLVYFKPNQSNEVDKRKAAAHVKVQDMFKDCFHDVNHASMIDVAMKTFPIMAIFLSQKKKAIRKQKLPLSKQKVPLSKQQIIFCDNKSRQNLVIV